MTRAVALVAAALLAASLGVAQETSTSGTAGYASRSSTNTLNSDGSTAHIGCLSGSDPGSTNFALAQDNTGDVFAVSGQPRPLSGGQLVQVTGNSTRANLEITTFEQVSSRCMDASIATPSGIGNELQIRGTLGSGKTMEKRHPILRQIAQKDNTQADDPVTPSENLPQTSTVLPLVGLVGVGSLIAGFFMRR